eukprot:snap_masked-scaffold_26-processed-gene-0.43-mRNA-1 protein AED:1.00 eAED:1.00 QI:0/0/0/0/1/1/3/0/82
MFRLILCPFYIIGKSFATLFQKFPRVESIHLIYCHLNELNFDSLKTVETISRIHSCRISWCKLPEDNSFLRFMSSLEVSRLK